MDGHHALCSHHGGVAVTQGRAACFSHKRNSSKPKTGEMDMRDGGDGKANEAELPAVPPYVAPYSSVSSTEPSDVHGDASGGGHARAVDLSVSSNGSDVHGGVERHCAYVCTAVRCCALPTRICCSQL
jgi:hypothetical protein